MYHLNLIRLSDLTSSLQEAKKQAQRHHEEAIDKSKQCDILQVNWLFKVNGGVGVAGEGGTGSE